MAAPVSPWRGPILLACCVAAFLILAGFLSWVLVDHDYEAEYLALGTLLVRGEINLYQDEMTGQWVPLPFYFFGLSQAIFGHSLLAARLAAILLSALVVVLIFALASRWGGALAGAAACGLFCTHGLVMGYFVTAHFSPLAAALILLGIYILFCTAWPARDLAAMGVFSVLFLVKPHYWPAIPFALGYALWRAGSARRRAVLIAVGVSVPLLFFAWDRQHWKMFAYMPILNAWVEPMGYYSWHNLIEDPAAVWVSDYADIRWDPSLGGRLTAMAKAFVFLLRRYAIWMALLAGLAALAAAQTWRGRASAEAWRPAGLWFTFWIFWYLVAWQFIIVGPYIKQSYAYVGAIAPLLAVVIGCLFAAAWSRVGLSGWQRRLAGGALVLALAVSPWVHRSPYLPRHIAAVDAEIPGLRAVAGRLAALIPTGERRVFLLGDPLPLHLANRQSYLRQFHQHLMVFTSSRDRQRYQRAGMWGPNELEEWLGSDARFAVIEPNVLEFYGRRKPYAEPVARISALLAQHFTLVETVREGGGHVFRVYRRNNT
jgi:4-amino-4-deoxy-L-arabinose transferase-like glycosyltransferase